MNSKIWREKFWNWTQPKTYSVLSSPLSLPQSIVAGLVNACHDEQCTVHLPARVIGPWSLWAVRHKLLLCSSSCRCCSSSIHSDLPISFLSYSRSLTQDSTARPRVKCGDSLDRRTLHCNGTVWASEDWLMAPPFAPLLKILFETSLPRLGSRCFPFRFPGKHYRRTLD